jgi:hypothetical protein
MNRTGVNSSMRRERRQLSGGKQTHQELAGFCVMPSLFVCQRQFLWESLVFAEPVEQHEQENRNDRVDRRQNGESHREPRLGLS